MILYFKVRSEVQLELSRKKKPAPPTTLAQKTSKPKKVQIKSKASTVKDLDLDLVPSRLPKPPRSKSWTSKPPRIAFKYKPSPMKLEIGDQSFSSSEPDADKIILVKGPVVADVTSALNNYKGTNLL